MFCRITLNAISLFKNQFYVFKKPSDCTKMVVLKYFHFMHFSSKCLIKHYKYVRTSKYITKSPLNGRIARYH